MEPSAQKCAGVIMWVALWWLSPIVPLHVTGLLGVLLAHFAGLMPWPELLEAYADPIIFLFMGGFILARAVEFHKISSWALLVIISFMLVAYLKHAKYGTPTK